MSDKDMFKEYVKACQEQEQAEMHNFANGVPGWYGAFYYELENGVMTVKESIYASDPLYYPD